MLNIFLNEDAIEQLHYDMHHNLIGSTFITGNAKAFDIALDKYYTWLRSQNVPVPTIEENAPLHELQYNTFYNMILSLLFCY